MRKLLLMAIAVICLTACGNANKSSQNVCCNDSTACDSITIIGSWVKPIDGQNALDGFKLNADGTAESINSATLVYKSWKQNSDSTITFISESIGNGQAFSDTTTWNIKKLDTDSLILTSGEMAFKYSRQK